MLSVDSVLGLVRIYDVSIAYLVGALTVGGTGGDRLQAGKLVLNLKMSGHDLVSLHSQGDRLWQIAWQLVLHLM